MCTPIFGIPVGHIGKTIKFLNNSNKHVKMRSTTIYEDFAASIGGEKYIIKVYEYFGVIAVFASSVFRLVYVMSSVCSLQNGMSS